MMALAETVQALDRRIAAAPVYVAKARRLVVVCFVCVDVSCWRLLASVGVVVVVSACVFLLRGRSRVLTMCHSHSFPRLILVHPLLTTKTGDGRARRWRRRG